MRKTRGNQAVADLSNEHAVVLAVANLGGQFRAVDTEDVAIEVVKLAPGRFMWRKYPEFINIELVHTALRDAKRLGRLLIGSGTAGWQLTSEGTELVSRLTAGGVSAAPSRRRLDPKEKAWMLRERSRLLSDEAFIKFRTQGSDKVTVREAERFFRLDDYVVGTARQQRVQRMLNFFGTDPELGSAIRELAKKVVPDEQQRSQQ